MTHSSTFPLQDPRGPGAIGGIRDDRGAGPLGDGDGPEGLILETGERGPGRALEWLWSLSIPVPFCRAGGSPRAQEEATPAVLGVALGGWRDSCSPCLVLPLGGRRAETFLQGEGMSGFGPGPAPHSCRAAWRKTVPSPPR